jgi:pimeloyl-ACP methyl ester carboxylesterase
MAFRSHRVGGYTPSEVHVVTTGANYTTSMGGRVVVYCHGAGGNGYIDGADIRTDLDRYAEAGHVVHAGLLGGNYTWGNQASVDAITAALTYLNTSFGANITAPMFVADSHGASIALNWAVRNPSQLGKAVLRVPAISLKTIHDTNVAGLAANMELAYTNLAGLVAAYPTRDANHTTFRALVVSSGIVPKLRLMYNDPDPIINKVDVLAFATATGVEAIEMGGPSHAPWGYFNINDQYKWLTS